MKRENLLLVVLFILSMLLASQLDAQTPPHRQPKKVVQTRRTKPIAKRKPVAAKSQANRNPETPPVSSTLSRSTATTTATPSTPVPASGYMGASSPLGYLFNRLTTDTTRNQPPHGKIGVTATLFMKGHLLTGFVVKKSVFYYGAGIGRYVNASSFPTSGNLILYGNAGIKTKSRASIGLLASVTLLAKPAYQYVGNQLEVTSKQTPTLGLGLQAHYELRKFIWVSATVHSSLGTGIGATYFF